MDYYTFTCVISHLQLIEGDRGESGSTSRETDGVNEAVATYNKEIVLIKKNYTQYTKYLPGIVMVAGEELVGQRSIL